MKTLVLVVGGVILLVLMYNYPNHVATVLFNPVYIIKNFFVDIYYYFKHKKINLYDGVGRVWAYCGAFGKGKTLAMVHDARMIYKNFDGKIVWWKGRFVVQRVNVYTNVEIKDIPYIKLNSLMDIVDVANKQPDFDDKNAIHTISVFCIDELSSLLNSRNFATNLNFDVIGSLLQCRKSSSKLMYTAQNFVEVDALIRRNTHYIVQCNKAWRFMFGYKYDAKDVEYAMNPNLCKPFIDYGWFVKNSDYNAYDTLSRAMAVDRNKITEDFITTQEAYARLDTLTQQLDVCNKLNHKGSKRQRQKLLI